MPLVNLYLSSPSGRKLAYSFYDENVSRGILNSSEIKGIDLLSEIDDQSPCYFSGAAEYKKLLNEVMILGGCENLRSSMLAFTELLAVIKFAQWNVSESVIEFSAVGLALDQYPSCIPRPYIQSLSGWLEEK